MGADSYHVYLFVYFLALKFQLESLNKTVKKLKIIYQMIRYVMLILYLVI